MFPNNPMTPTTNISIPSCDVIQGDQFTRHKPIDLCKTMKLIFSWTSIKKTWPYLHLKLSSFYELQNKFIGSPCLPSTINVNNDSIFSSSLQCRCSCCDYAQYEMNQNLSKVATFIVLSLQRNANIIISPRKTQSIWKYTCLVEWASWHHVQMLH